jgi:hypothetical protein
MRRQRVLERAGWRFWRCFATNYVLHKDDVVRDLIDTLAAHGIQPSSVDAPVNTIYVESRNVVAFPRGAEDETYEGEDIDRGKLLLEPQMS